MNRNSQPGLGSGLTLACLISSLSCTSALAQEPIEGLEMGVQHVEIRGEGPIPLVLVPDIGFDWSVFETFMERNAKLYTMYALTLPGMVGTDVPPPRERAHWKELHLTLNAVAAIRQMIRDHELNKPVILGHGYGGHLALIVATRHPDDTRAVISLNGQPYIQIGSPKLKMTEEERDMRIEQKMVSPFRYLTEQQWDDHWRTQMITRVTDPDRADELVDQYLTTPRGVVMQYSIEMLFSDVKEDLKTNQVPILFIAPADPTMPVHLTGMSWKTLLGEGPLNTTLAIFEDCRHFVMDDDPWRLDPTVDDFIHGRKIENTRVSQGVTKPKNPELQNQESDH